MRAWPLIMVIGSVRFKEAGAEKFQASIPITGAEELAFAQTKSLLQCIAKQTAGRVLQVLWDGWLIVP